jgi:hypothetical protein
VAEGFTLLVSAPVALTRFSIEINYLIILKKIFSEANFYFY